MLRVLVVGEEAERIRELREGLAGSGMVCTYIPDLEHEADSRHKRAADLALVAINGVGKGSQYWAVPERIKADKHIPVVALVTRDSLIDLDSAEGIDDFVIEPWDTAEVVARMKRVLNSADDTEGREVINRGDLAIDLDRCEVTVAGRLTELTFKEYELLRVLAANPGRVFTRETLLNKVWGYDYFGGDRTVDVHIRRLRAKIEDSRHVFIETVRNIGYRFKAGR